MSKILLLQYMRSGSEWKIVKNVDFQDCSSGTQESGRFVFSRCQTDNRSVMIDVVCRSVYKGISLLQALAFCDNSLMYVRLSYCMSWGRSEMLYTERDSKVLTGFFYYPEICRKIKLLRFTEVNSLHQDRMRHCIYSQCLNFLQQDKKIQCRRCQSEG